MTKTIFREQIETTARQEDLSRIGGETKLVQVMTLVAISAGRSARGGHALRTPHLMGLAKSLPRSLDESVQAIYSRHAEACRDLSTGLVRIHNGLWRSLEAAAKKGIKDEEVRLQNYLRRRNLRYA